MRKKYSMGPGSAKALLKDALELGIPESYLDKVMEVSDRAYFSGRMDERDGIAVNAKGYGISDILSGISAESGEQLEEKVRRTIRDYFREEEPDPVRGKHMLELCAIIEEKYPACPLKAFRSSWERELAEYQKALYGHAKPVG